MDPPMAGRAERDDMVVVVGTGIRKPARVMRLEVGVAGYRPERRRLLATFAGFVGSPKHVNLQVAASLGRHHVVLVAGAVVVQDALGVPIALVAELAGHVPGYDDDQRHLDRGEDPSVPLKASRPFHSYWISART